MIRKSITLIILVLFTATVFANNGTQIGIAGARSSAMASCFRGLADDWSAMFFNPGGLTQLNSKWTIGGSVGLIMPRGDYTQSAYPVSPFSGMYIDERDATPQNFYVPAVGIFYKASESFTIGLGVYAPFGLGTDWNLMTLPSTYGNLLSKENEHYSDHQVVNIQPTVAFKLSDKISLGLGVSYVTGDMSIDNVALPFNPAAANWSELQVLASLLGLDLTALTGDQYRLAVENTLNGSGSAYGFNFGLHIKFSEKLHLGLSGRYSTDLKLKGTFKQTMLMHGDQDKANTIMNIPAEYLADESDPTGANNRAALAGLFSGQDIVNTDESNAEADLPLPMTLGGGIAFKPSPRLTLTADVSWTNWDKWDIITIEGANGEVGEFEQNWKNTIEMGAGFELLVKEHEAKRCFLRGGFYTVDSPAPDETMTPTILDPIRRYVITGGLGVNLGKISFNLAGEYFFFGEKEVDRYVFDPSNGTADNYAGIYNFNALVFTLSTTISL